LRFSFSAISRRRPLISAKVSARNEAPAHRRLFQRFQQRVGRLVRQHVRFVENHHFAARRSRRVTHHLAQFANLVDAAVRSRVDFNHVERGSRRDLLAGIAFAARLGRRPLRAIQRFGQDARRRRFAHAPRAGKNVRVRHAIVADRVGQRLRDVLLPDQIPERLWPPLPCNHLIGHKSI
jgi:hypothetical protein